MPGAAVFSSLQFQEYNEGEVNTKQKKGRSLFPCPFALLCRLHKKQQSDSGCIPTPFIIPPCSSLLPYMTHPWFERSWSKGRDMGGSKVISWDLTKKVVEGLIISFPFPLTLTRDIKLLLLHSVWLHCGVTCLFLFTHIHSFPHLLIDFYSYCLESLHVDRVEVQ